MAGRAGERSYWENTIVLSNAGNHRWREAGILILTLAHAWVAHGHEYSGGSGTADDPYQIATAEQLLAIEHDEILQTEHFVLVADIDMHPDLTGGKLLTRGLTLSTGSMDGRGHSVRNLHGRVVTETPRGRREVDYGSPLFDRIGCGAVVSNLRLEGTATKVNQSRGLATLAHENAGHVVNCSFEGMVSSPDDRASWVAGLVGRNAGTIVDCRFTGSVVGSTTGGLVSENAGRVVNCSVEGVVSSPDDRASWVAGLVGKNAGTIVDCRFMGSVVGSTAGGLVSENAGTILSCVATGTVGGNKAGGLAAINSDIIMHSHSTCSVTGGSGLVHENSGTIVGCYATGEVTDGPAGLVGTNSGTIRYCYATGDVQTSEGWAGGLVAVNVGRVCQCYATGQLLAGNEAGGLVGSNEGAVRQCYATGSGGAALVARNDGGIVWICYALSPFDGGRADDGVGFLLTDTQMRRQKSFVGWDFSGTQSDGSLDDWTMPPDGGYPALTVIDASGSAGTGTLDDPYLIETFPQFMAVSREPAACYRMTADINLQGESFASPIIPVFWGDFDGGGHSVSDITFAGDKTLGLFGVLYAQATVLDLYVEQVQVVLGAEGPHPQATAVGALAVRNLGMVTDCSTSVDVSVRSESYFHRIGGLIGINEAGEIRRCSASFAMAHAVARSDTYSKFVGGLVGHNSGTITQSHASSYAYGGLFASGGLAGLNDGSIVDCHADGFFSGDFVGRTQAAPLLGGLVGSNRGNITRCHATTVVAAPDSGGLVGENPEGVIADSYFLSEADGGGRDNGWGVPLSEGRMKQQASFAGWDFDDVWWILEGQDYPRVWWELATEQSLEDGP